MISVFELFKIGVGPSSSHTVGPMKAAAAFASGLVERGAIGRVAEVGVTLYGSLAYTGRGHATDKAVILGLSGIEPEAVDPDTADALVAKVRESKRLPLAGRRTIAFDPASAIVLTRWPSLRTNSSGLAATRAPSPSPTQNTKQEGNSSRRTPNTAAASYSRGAWTCTSRASTIFSIFPAAISSTARATAAS